jgi:hypothetical protein
VLAAPRTAQRVAAPVRKPIGQSVAPRSAAPASATRALATARAGGDWEEF